MGFLDRFRKPKVQVEMRDALNLQLTRVDGWENPTTGFGVLGRDKMMDAVYCPDLLIPDAQLSALYYGNDIASTVVDEIVTQSFREGYCLSSDDEEMSEDLNKWANKELNLDSQVQEAIKWGRLFGGCLLIVGANDGTLDQPLNEKRVTDVVWTLVVDRRFVQPNTWYQSLGPKFAQPETYRIQLPYVQALNKFSIVHESRCIRFGGVPVDLLMKQKTYYSWDLSVLQRTYPIIRAFSAAFQGMENMLADASQGVFSIKGLINMLAEKNKKALHERMTMMDMGRSAARSIVLDADGEKFEKVATVFTGVSDVIDRAMQRLSAATKIPVAILMGRSAAGMNATGDLDIKAWNSQVRSFQNNEISNKLLKLYSLISLSKRAPTKGKQIEDLQVAWKNLEQLSDKEKADLYSTMATADASNVNAQIYDPAEIAIARAGRGEFSIEVPKVDVSKLEKELAARESFDVDPSLDPKAQDPIGNTTKEDPKSNKPDASKLPPG